MTLDACLPQQIRPDIVRVALELDDLTLGVAADIPATGFHAENLLIIMEEAQGIPDPIWDAADYSFEIVPKRLWQSLST